MYTSLYSIGVTNPEHRTILQQELLRMKLLIQQLKVALLGMHSSIASYSGLDVGIVCIDKCLCIIYRHHHLPSPSSISTLIASWLCLMLHAVQGQLLFQSYQRFIVNNAVGADITALLNSSSRGDSDRTSSKLTGSFLLRLFYRGTQVR
jgi:hypothetical protein